MTTVRNVIQRTYLKVSLREATKEDLELLFNWRNQPEVWQGFYTQSKENRALTWTEHWAWWLSRNKDWRTFIIEYEGKPVGVVTIGQLDYWEPETGIYIGEVSLWGKGIAKRALELAIDYIKNYGRKYTRTSILDKNERSKKLYESLGFKRIGEARPGESLYRKQI